MERYMQRGNSMTSAIAPPRSSRRHPSALALLVICALFASFASPTFAKKGGNGKGNGNGNGGGGGNAEELNLELHPDVWNLNWEHSEGQLHAFVRGDGFGDIDPASVALVGDAGSALPLNVKIAGKQLKAVFSKQDALATLGDPQKGDVRTLTLEFTADGVPGALTDTVRIVGGGDDGDDDDDGEEPEELGLAVKPRKWNTNYIHSHGTVQVFFRGEGVEDVDLSSIQLIGDDPVALPVEAIVAKLSGHHVMARFSKSAAFDSLLDPVLTGEERIIKIRFLLAGAPTEVELKVLILGP